jgi:hypothetical protein
MKMIGCPTTRTIIIHNLPSAPPIAANSHNNQVIYSATTWIHNNGSKIPVKAANTNANIPVFHHIDNNRNDDPAYDLVGNAHLHQHIHRV